MKLVQLKSVLLTPFAFIVAPPGTDGAESTGFANTTFKPATRIWRIAAHGRLRTWTW